MKMSRVITLALSSLIVVSICFAQASKKKGSSSMETGKHDPHVMLTPDQIQWGPAPPSLPPGAQLAVLAGDPFKAGALFNIRAKLPDGYKIPAHWHPTDENVVVIEGTLMMGLGDKLDESASHAMTVGSYALMPKGVRHYAWAKGETVIQVYGIGPFAMNYVNPADDPSPKSHK
jgi:quercetin dioxygenase-like cupin family protein